MDHGESGWEYTEFGVLLHECCHSSYLLVFGEALGRFA
jgi:hypothetical protein